MSGKSCWKRCSNHISYSTGRGRLRDLRFSTRCFSSLAGRLLYRGDYTGIPVQQCERIRSHKGGNVLRKAFGGRFSGAQLWIVPRSRRGSRRLVHVRVQHDRRCEIGIATLEKHQQKGIATLAARHFLVEACQRGYTRVGWDCWKSNIASGATARKAGLRSVRSTRRWLWF